MYNQSAPFFYCVRSNSTILIISAYNLYPCVSVILPQVNICGILYMGKLHINSMA